MSRAITYRHWPFHVATTFGAGVVIAVLVLDVVSVVRDPSVEQTLMAVLLGVPLLAADAFFLLYWRVRTVVDAHGITQHWIRTSHHIPFAEITDLEAQHYFARWFLRIYCTGGRTFEVIPSPNVLPGYLALAIGPPRALAACCRHIERALHPVVIDAGSAPSRRD